MTNGLLVLNNDYRVVCCSDGAATLLGLRRHDIVGREIDDIFYNKADSDETGTFIDTLTRLIGSAVENPSGAKVILSRPNLIELSVAVFHITLRPGERIIALLLEQVTYERRTTRQWDATVAILAHELSNPLTVIIAYSDLMLSETPLNSTQRKWMENIRVSGDRIEALGSALVNAAHIGSNDVTVNLERFTVCEAVDRVVTAFTLSATNHSFEVEITSELPEVIGNRFKLDQVLRNLLDNAVKYSPPGTKVTITAHHQPERQRVVIGVGDQGIGIALEDRVRIFSPNERITHSETENIWGVGLGLFIVRELVELMSGKVWLDSELDQGSTFFFSLPTAP